MTTRAGVAAAGDRRRSSESARPPLWAGGVASCAATLVSHPFDLTKVRLQTIRKQISADPHVRRRVISTRMVPVMWTIVKTEGVRALYGGLSASLLRQGTYSTIRFGLYDAFKWLLVEKDKKPTWGQLLLCSTAAGILGGASGNPSDVVNVRMQNDGQLPPAQRRNYRHALDGLVRICREEGARVLLRGVGYSTSRAVVMTVSQMMSYDIFKELLLSQQRHRNDSLGVHFASSVGSALVATTACSPFDVIKTRIMSAHTADDRRAFKIIHQMVRNEGILSLFKGWVPAFVRLGPHTIVTFIVMEYIRDWHTQSKPHRQHIIQPAFANHP
ncbi:mitochondrial dicarboxylate transporter [Dichotomocladium elegans]|nr:mitochondrial dicarboxylate transporter [Dichotomocladium elegans]